MTLEEFKKKYGTETLALIISDLAVRANLNDKEQVTVSLLLDDVRALLNCSCKPDDVEACRTCSDTAGR